MNRAEDVIGLTASSAADSRTTEGPLVFIDLTHLGRHVTGLERVSIEQFERVEFAGADVRHVKANGVVSMILRQQLLLPWLALRHPEATFVFPGFPPSLLMTLIPDRVVMYVHDLFLVTRRADLGLKARLYMAPAFARAVAGLKRFLVNSEKTEAELRPFTRSDAKISLYRPKVGNVFGLTPDGRPGRIHKSGSLDIVMVGTVEPRKNYGAALDLLEALTRHGFPQAKLHIVGRKGWGDAADRLAGNPNVIVHGYLDAAAAKRVIESADVYLSTSHDEGLGLPLLEAQYAGLPVIAPDKPVFREVLGSSGTFIDTADPDAAARAVARLAADAGAMREMAARSIANVARWNEEAEHDAERARTMFAARG